MQGLLHSRLLVLSFTRCACLHIKQWTVDSVEVSHILLFQILLHCNFRGSKQFNCVAQSADYTVHIKHGPAFVNAGFLMLVCACVHLFEVPCICAVSLDSPYEEEDQGDLVAALFASSPVYCTVYSHAAESDFFCMFVCDTGAVDSDVYVSEVPRVLFLSILSTKKRIKET